MPDRDAFGNPIEARYVPPTPTVAPEAPPAAKPNTAFGVSTLAARPRTPGSALALAIAGLFVAPLILSIPAIVLAARYRADARARGTEVSPVATVATALGWLGVLFGLFIVLGVIGLIAG